MSERPIVTALGAAAEAAIAAEARYGRLDAVTGDGDLGGTLARGARAVQAVLAEPPAEDAALLSLCAERATDVMGGTSGALWGVGLLRAGGALAGHGPQAGRALRAAFDGVVEYGGAAVGDKTLLDALDPAVRALEAGGTLDDAADAAADGARATAELRARRGRAAYGGARSDGAVDPGAVAFAELLRAAVTAAPEIEPLADAGDAGAGAPADGAGEAAAAPRGILGDPDRLVADGLAGFVAAHPELVRLGDGARWVGRAAGPTRGHVGVVSGGGSGHEPLHAGFVGEGMLTAAAPGPIFSSPSPGQVLEATRAADGGAGVLHVVKNYTGDVLNFRLAAEMAEREGIRVRAVVVADDAATDDDQATGRRGTGLSVLVEKAAGARAEAGGSLDQVEDVATRAAAAGASFGVALEPGQVPGAGRVIDLDVDEIEIGVGIHGEPGRERGSWRPAPELAAALVGPVLDRLGGHAAGGGSVLLLLSGLGATPPLQLHLLHHEILGVLGDRGIVPERRLVGDLVTSLDTAGALLTLAVLDDELLALWDAPCRTPALVR